MVKALLLQHLLPYAPHAEGQVVKALLLQYLLIYARRSAEDLSTTSASQSAVDTVAATPPPEVCPRYCPSLHRQRSAEDSSTTSTSQSAEFTVAVTHRQRSNRALLSAVPAVPGEVYRTSRHTDWVLPAPRGLPEDIKFPHQPVAGHLPPLYLEENFPHQPVGGHFPLPAWGADFPTSRWGATSPFLPGGANFPQQPVGGHFPLPAWGANFHRQPVGVHFPFPAWGAKFPHQPVGGRLISPNFP